jgi:hypothetical protein
MPKIIYCLRAPPLLYCDCFLAIPLKAQIYRLGHPFLLLKEKTGTMQAINANPVLLDYDTCRDQSKQLGVETWFQVMFMWMGKDDGTLRPRIYGITAANLTTYMLLHPGDERLAIIDTRTIDEAGE